MEQAKMKSMKLIFSKRMYKSSFINDMCRLLCSLYYCSSIVFTMRFKLRDRFILKHKIFLQTGKPELVISDKEIIHFNKSRELMGKFFV